MSATLARFDLRNLKLSQAKLWRGVVAGCAWGISMGIGFAAFQAWQCGGICLPDAALTAALSVGAGVLGIGPVAAFGRRA